MTETETTTEKETPSAAIVPLRIRYRIRFAKIDLLRWISHRDLARLWERLVRRANLQLSMTEGFHPKPRIGFPSALALGVEGKDEVVELELAEELPPAELLNRLCADNQPGLVINSVKQLPERFGKAQLLRSDYIITMNDAVDTQATQQAIDRLLVQETVSVKRKQKTLSVVVATQIPVLQIHEGQLQLSLAASESATLRPLDVLQLLGCDDWIENGTQIIRTRVVLEKEFETDDPRYIAPLSSAVSSRDQTGGNEC